MSKKEASVQLIAALGAKKFNTAFAILRSGSLSPREQFDLCVRCALFGNPGISTSILEYVFIPATVDWYNLAGDINVLIQAARLRRLRLAKILLENGADPNVRNRVGKTALHLTRSLEMVKLFVEAGYSIRHSASHKAHRLRSPMYYHLTRNNRLPIIAYLMSQGESGYIYVKLQSDDILPCYINFLVYASIIPILLSAREIPRVGHQAPIQLLPTDLVRLLRTYLVGKR